MTHWNYRVIKFENSPGDTYYAIHDVYYNEDGKLNSYGLYAADVIWQDVGEGESILDMMREAFAKPVLTPDDFK